MIYAIGDIHGQLTMLNALLDVLRDRPLAEEDTVVFLGDYIDRGENSCGVVETLLAFREAHGKTIFLRGNHEQLLLDARDGPEPQPAHRPGYLLHSDETLLWLQNGGIETLDSYGVTDYSAWWESIPDAHWEFYRATELEFIGEHYHFVHAGLLPPGKNWPEAIHGLDARLWIREPFLSSRHSFDGKIVVFGHTPQRTGKPLAMRNKLGLDTGAVFGGPLSMAALDDSEDSPSAFRSLIYQAAYA